MTTEDRTPITHVIFDFDGTLINSLDVVQDMIRGFAESHGKEVPPDLKPTGEDMKSQFKIYFDSLQLNDKLTLEEFIKQISEKYFDSDFQLNPGVDKLIKHLHEKNIPMAIATNSSKQAFYTVAKKFGNYFDAGNYFSHIVCAKDDEEVVYYKPHPDVFIVCAQRFESQSKSKKNVLVIEDSLIGIKAGIADGMQTLLVYDMRLNEFQIDNNLKTNVIDSFHDFKPEDFGLPTFIF